MKKDNSIKFSISCFIVAILGFVLSFVGGLGFIPCVVAIILAIVCLATKYKGKAYAIIGMIIAIFGAIISPFACAAFLGATALTSMVGLTNWLTDVNQAMEAEDSEKMSAMAEAPEYNEEYYKNVLVKVPIEFTECESDEDSCTFIYGGKEYDLPEYVLKCDETINMENFGQNVRSILGAEPDSEETEHTLTSEYFLDGTYWYCGTVEYIDANQEPAVSVFAYSDNGIVLVVLTVRPGEQESYEESKQELLDIARELKFTY